MLSKLLAKLIKFFSKRYWLFLIFVVAVSYGQMLWMQPWEDDNALFFKLAHIQEPVGFFGKGPLGEGIYKYAAVPFIPIYNLFGFYVPAYFALLLILYMAAAIAVYKVFSKILGENRGRIAGFIYAAGYITSDSFWRMANSATTSITIILASVFLYLYWRYYKEKKLGFYFLALAAFLVAVEYSVVRNHYLFAVVVFFELIFLAFRKPIKSIVFSVVRILPFLYIFYKWVILAGDARAGGVGEFIKSILNGQFYQTYGVISSLANLVIPDYITTYIFNVFGGGRAAVGFLFILVAVCLFLVLRRQEKRKFWITASFLALVIWYFFSRDVYTIPLISPGIRQIFIVALGGIIILIFLAKLVVLRSKGKIFLFLGLWLCINALAYSTYYPTIAYDSINRYLAHSFFAYAGILGFLSRKKPAAFLIVIFGLLNIFNAVKYQGEVLKSRSIPVKKFYEDLSLLLPRIEKGDTLYFDVSSDARGYFRDAISAAMMPDTASFAWRYGIDRYDFNLVTDFKDLEDSGSIHSYWYSAHALVDTTSDIRGYFSKRKPTFFLGSGPLKIASATPSKIRVRLAAQPPTYDALSLSASPQKFNLAEIKKALEYKLSVEDFRKNSTFEVSSTWQDRLSQNLSDGDPDSVWQPDRVLWKDKKEYLKVRLPAVREISGVTLQTASFKDSLLTGFEISISVDGVNWNKVSDGFETFPSVKAGFVRVDFKSTLGDEAPMIAEFGVIPAELSSIDIGKSGTFLEDPFKYVFDLESFKLILAGFNYKGMLKAYWLGDKEKDWQSAKETEFEVVYDGRPRDYYFTVPAGGTFINEIKFVGMTIPGKIDIR